LGKNFLKYSGVFLLLLLFSSVSGQERFAFSKNGHFMAHVIQKGRHGVTGDFEYGLKVYGVRQQAIVMDKSFYHQRSEMIDFQVSPSGRLITLAFADRVFVINVINRKIIAETNPESAFCFPHYANIFLVKTGDLLYVRDGQSGKLIQKKKIAGWEPIGGSKITNGLTGGILAKGRVKSEILDGTKIFSSPQDDFFVVEFEDAIEIFDFSRLKLKKRFDNVYSWSLNTDLNILNVAMEFAGGITVQRFGFPSLRKITKGKLSRVFGDLIEARSINPRLGDSKKGKLEIRRESLSLSPNGGYLMFLADYAEQKESELYIYSIDKDEIVGNYTFEGKDIENDAAFWIREHLICIPSDKMVSLVFNVEDSRFEEDIKFEFDFSTADWKKGKWRQVLERVITQDQFFSALPNGNEEFVLRKNQNGEEFLIKDFYFVGFSHDSKWGFVRNKENTMFFFSLKEVPHQKLQEFRTDFNFAPEDEIKKDAEIPHGFSYKPLKNIIPFEQHDGADSLELILKTVVSGNNHGTEVQIIDKEGNYYRGASKTELKSRWCLVEVEKDGQIKETNNFSITEVSTFDSVPMAVTVLLDFSGSMGWNRSELLTEGAINLVKAKGSKDVVSVYKYDDKIIEEILLEKKLATILASIWTSSFGEFGGATALLDALNAGIVASKKSSEKMRSIVILMTDGMENASFSSKNEVIGNAVRNGVSVYTIGFGDKVDNEFLKSIAYSTGGGHYNIFSRFDFSWVLKDVFARSQNYYSIKLGKGEEQSKIRTLKLCPDRGVPDSLVIEYDPTPGDLQVIAKMEEGLLVNPLKRSNKSTRTGRRSQVDYYSLNNRVKDRIGRTDTEGEKEEDKMAKEFSEIILPQFNFHHDKLVTLSGTEARIQNLIAFMKKYPSAKIVVEGNTDNSGTYDYNMVLSEQRAERVKDMIVEKGADEERMMTMGYGETKPVASNATPKGMEENRRVVFRLWKP
jgi:outer membrane protein OmpA-like peptidoglycan-associated protein